MMDSRRRETLARPVAIDLRTLTSIRTLQTALLAVEGTSCRSGTSSLSAAMLGEISRSRCSAGVRLWCLAVWGGRAAEGPEERNRTGLCNSCQSSKTAPWA